MYRYLNILFLIILLAVSGFSTACVKQSLDECEDPVPPGPTPEPGSQRVVLYVDFEENRTRAYDRTVVEYLAIYVFDSNDRYVTTIEDYNPAIGEAYSINLDLSPDKYRFIAWTNLHQDYANPADELIPGISTVQDLYVELLEDDEGNAGELTHALHYGSLSEAEIVEGSDHEFYLWINAATYIINIVTYGLPYDEDGYRFIIRDTNGGLDHEGNVTEKEMCYATVCDKDGDGQISATLRVLRLMEDHLDARITIEDTDTGEMLFDTELIPLLLSLRDKGVTVDFSSVFEYTIVLEFGGSSLISIYINNWKVYEYYEEL